MIKGLQSRGIIFTVALSHGFDICNENSIIIINKLFDKELFLCLISFHHLHYLKSYFLNIFIFTDIHKLDEWEVIIESDIKTMEWVDSESSGEDSEDDDDDDSDSEGEGMDTSQ